MLHTILAAALHNRSISDVCIGEQGHPFLLRSRYGSSLRVGLLELESLLGIHGRERRGGEKEKLGDGCHGERKVLRHARETVFKCKKARRWEAERCKAQRWSCHFLYCGGVSGGTDSNFYKFYHNVALLSGIDGNRTGLAHRRDSDTRWIPGIDLSLC